MVLVHKYDTSIYTHGHAHTYTHTHKHAHTYTHTHKHAHTHTHTHIQIYINTHMNMYIHTYTRRIYVYIWFVHSWIWNEFLKHTNICRPWGTYTVARPFIHITLCKLKWKLLSRVQLFATSWTVAYQAPQSMGFSKQVYWTGLPFPSPWL